MAMHPIEGPAAVERSELIMNSEVATIVTRIAEP